MTPSELSLCTSQQEPQLQCVRPQTRHLRRRPAALHDLKRVTGLGIVTTTPGPEEIHLARWQRWVGFGANESETTGNTLYLAFRQFQHDRDKGR